MALSTNGHDTTFAVTLGVTLRAAQEIVHAARVKADQIGVPMNIADPRFT